jgi:hypothetical protein
VLDQARQHAFLAGRPARSSLHRGLEIREGIADQQRALLPVAQEGGRRHAQRLAGAGGDFDQGAEDLRAAMGESLAAESGGAARRAA